MTVSVSSSDTTEGTTDVSSLTFTPADWNTPQIVTATGVDDAMEDDDVQYHVVFGPAVSSDPVYNGLDAPDVLFINIDDDAFTPTVIFADSFESGQWSGKWVEDSQNDWFTSTQRSTAGNYSAEVDGLATNATLTVANPIDMSGYGSAELSFDWYIESGFDSGEYVKLDFWNGFSWIEIRSLGGNVDQENTWHSETVHLENEPSGDYLRSDFQFRFRANVSSSTEDANVDNVQLLATSLSGPPNEAPSITSAPVTAASEDSLYSYDVDAADPNPGDAITFSLNTAPAGMTINSSTGVILWTPTNTDVGNHSIVVRAEDAGGLFDTQSFDILVANVNDAPSIISTPVASATEDAFYSYDVNASDPDVGDTLTFWLDTSPVGMSINSSSGLIEWTPTNGQIGDHSVTVRVEDASGDSDVQSFLITVSPAGPSETELFYDSFEMGNNNNDWNGKWVEDSQNDFFRSTQRATDGIRSAEVDGFANNATLTLSTPVDISGFASAQLTFDWLIESGFDSGEFLSLDISTNGGSSWTQNVLQLRGNVDVENTWHNETVDLAAYSSTNLLIRFRSSVSGSSEDADIDNVRIVGSSVASPGWRSNQITALMQPVTLTFPVNFLAKQII